MQLRSVQASDRTVLGTAAVTRAQPGLGPDAGRGTGWEPCNTLHGTSPGGFDWDLVSEVVGLLRSVRGARIRRGQDRLDGGVDCGTNGAWKQVRHATRGEGAWKPASLW